MGKGYIAPLSNQVRRTSVMYRNRYGMSIAADIYIAQDADLEQKHPALIVGAPYGGVKEQGPCVYSNFLS